MASTSTTASQTAYCKIKRVYPRLSLHVHSAAEQGFNAKGLGYLRPTLSAALRHQPRDRAANRS